MLFRDPSMHYPEDFVRSTWCKNYDLLIN